MADRGQIADELNDRTRAAPGFRGPRAGLTQLLVDGVDSTS